MSGRYCGPLKYIVLIAFLNRFTSRILVRKAAVFNLGRGNLLFRISRACNEKSGKCFEGRNYDANDHPRWNVCKRWGSRFGSVLFLLACEFGLLGLN